VKAAVDQAIASEQQSIETGRMMENGNALIHSMLTFHQSVKISADGTGAVVTAPITCDQVLAFLIAWRDMRLGNDGAGFWGQ
jgi:hypothetical protein